MSEQRNIWAFAGMAHEAGGGCEDLVGRFATLDEAIEGLKTAWREEYVSLDWWHIVDVSTGTVLRGTSSVGRSLTPCTPEDADVDLVAGLER